MRLSIVESDPGYDMKATSRCKVLVDGVDVTNRCHTADEEERKAWCYKLNEFGKKFASPDRTKVVQEVLTGDVKILLNARD